MAAKINWERCYKDLIEDLKADNARLVNDKNNLATLWDNAKNESNTAYQGFCQMRQERADLAAALKSIQEENGKRFHKLTTEIDTLFRVIKEISK